MDGVELVGLIFFGAMALIGWGRWYADLFRINRLAAPDRIRLTLGVAPVFCLAVLFVALRTIAAHDVRDDSFWIAYYLVIGAGWVGAANLLFPFLGVSVRDDALERRNLAAMVAGLGAVLGATMSFSGANVGDGPGVHVVVAAAGLATLSLLLLWLGFELISGQVVAERITVERDLGAGIRLAGFLAGGGAIFGAAVAGDWVEGRLLADFIEFAWPALPLLAVASLAEWVWDRRLPAALSVLVAGAYMAAGAACFARWGLE
jgi:uncharacterized membrane protein YjfL (UPF0719 family)